MGTEGGSRQTKVFVLIGCGVLAAGGCVVAIAAGIMLGLAPAGSGPFAGEGSAHVILTADRAPSGDDATILIERLEALGVDVTVGVRAPDRLELTLEDVSDPVAAVQAVLPRHELAFRVECESQAAVGRLPENALMGIDFEMIRGQEVAVARDPATLAPILTRAAQVPGCLAVVDCTLEDSAGTRCFPIVVGQDAVITNSDISSASAATDPVSGQPVVWVEMTADGAARFAAATERAAANRENRRRIALIVDGESLSSPVVQERIAGGTAQITLGTASSIEQSLADAHALAASISRAPLTATWSLASLD